ncbi:MAG: sugar phosphate isomerase/epimerase [Acidimicrobiales bacterium]|nr:sugar phosphate isomerase/epimerase [Acidimicrobiales bacterium]
MIRLGITSSTLGNPPFPELVRAVAAGGFELLAVWPAADRLAAHAAGLTDADLRAVLEHHGVIVRDIDALVVWVGPDDPGGPYFEEPTQQECFETGEALGATHLNVLLTGPATGDLDAAAEVFAGVCERASRHGLTCTLEFSPTREPASAAGALEILRRSGRTEAGLCIDTWHHHWGPDDVTDLERLPGERIQIVQVNDAPAVRPADYGHATRYERLVPGDGAIDLAAIVRAVRSTGSQAPFIAEIFNADLVAMGPPDVVARHVGDRMRELMARPR